MQGRLVRLSHPTEDDFQLMARWFTPDFPTAAFTGGSFSDPVTAEALAELVRSGRKRYLMIRRLSDDTVVGAVDYQTSANGNGHMQIGTAISDPTLWQQGYAADAMVVLVDYLFHARNARIIQINVGIFNKRSLEAVAAGGFTCEGIMRERMYLDGRWHDVVVWSMLRSEYYQKVAQDTQASDRWRLQDLVPEEEKVAARRSLARHLRSGRARTTIGALLDSEPATAAESAKPAEPVGATNGRAAR